MCVYDLAICITTEKITSYMVRYCEPVKWTLANYRGPTWTDLPPAAELTCSQLAGCVGVKISGYVWVCTSTD